MTRLWLMFFVMIVMLAFVPSYGKVVCPKIAPPGSWRELSTPKYIWPGEAIYYSYKLGNGSKVHLVVVDMKTGKWVLRPVMTTSTAPLSQTAASENAAAAVNGGFFNLSDGVSASYIVVNSQ